MAPGIIDVGPFQGDYLLLPPCQSGARTGLQLATSGVANQVTIFPFHLNRVMLIRGAGLSIATLQAGVFAYTGLFDFKGNLLVQGKFSCAAVADLNQLVPVPVTLNPGMYFYGLGCEGTVANGNGPLFDSGAFNCIPGTGVAVNPIAGGSMPANLGSPLPVGFSFPGSMCFGIFF